MNIMVGLKIESTEQLCGLIEQWNENRLDLFHLEYLGNMEFRGIMRFYYQEPGEKVTTKCLRISSFEIVRDVVALLIEKFRPDLKMLSQALYSIWEVHENGCERKLMLDESPLIAQLCWQKDDLEGRFLLRRDDFLKSPSRSSNGSSLKSSLSRSKNRFSKREKRELTRKSRTSPKTEIDEDSRSIYAELPPNTFTRTISNPEIVMQKRREQKIENRLKEITNGGGSLKIYGIDLFPNRPYVTLLVNTSDNSEKIIADALDKYGLENAPARNFLLVEMLVPTEGSEMSRSLSDYRMTGENIERELGYEEFPLLNLLSRHDAKNIVHLLRRRLDNSYECANISSTLTTARIDNSLLTVKGSPTFFHDIQQTANAESVNSSSHNTQAYNRMHQLTAQNGRLHEPHHNGVKQEYLQHASSADPTTPANIGACDKEIPALLDLPNQTCENQLLKNELFGFPPSHFLFRLTPAFTVYMVCRQRLSQYLIPQQSVELRLQKIATFVGHFVDLCLDTIYSNANDCELLMFWLANSSEICHMFYTDVDLRKCERFGMQIRLMRLVEKTYELFVEYCRIAIRPTIHTLINVSLEDDASTDNIVGLLEEIIRLIRKAFLNSALTIQLFSQLFHFINMYIFNWLVTTEEGKCYLSRAFGLRLRRRLYKVQKWAERQGLEQACECHMDRIQQTVDLLTTPKTSDQIASLGATCYKLNSVQVRYLLENYVIDPELERPVANELIDHVAFLASGQADAIETQDGHEPQLEETQQLQLPFLFPRDAYLVEVLQGLSPELVTFIIALQEKGIARLLVQNTTSWTCHMQQDVMDATDEFQTNLLKTSYNTSLISYNNTNTVDNSYDAVPTHLLLESPPRPATQPFRGTQNNNTSLSTSTANQSVMLNSSTARSVGVDPSSSTEPSEYSVVTIRRGQEKSIGLSIVAGHLKFQPIGIYVKKVLEGSPAFRNGRLATGDQLLSVNGQSLVGITQEEAAIKMANAGAEVCFEVSKGAAKRNGLDASLRADEPSLPSQHLPRYQNASMRSLSSKNNAISRGMQPSLRILSNPTTSSLHNKSLSTSELHSQTDAASINSDFSQLNPYIGSSIQPQPIYSGNHYQHNNQSSTLYSKLPAHYRPSNIRPSTSAQFDRSSASVLSNSAQRELHTSTSVIHNGDFRDANDNYSIITKQNSGAEKMFRQNSVSSAFSGNIKAPLADAETVSLNSVNMMSSSVDNAFNEQQQKKLIATKIGSSSIDFAHRTIAGLPQMHAHTNSSSSTSPLQLPFFSKNTNLTFSPANSASSNTSSLVLTSPMRTSALTGDYQDTGNSRIPPPMVPKSAHIIATSSERRSAPLFDVHEIHTSISTVDEIKSELNRLQLAGLNTDAEKFHYNQLLQRLQLSSKSTSTLPNNFINNRQLMRQIHSASVLGVESRHQPQLHLPYMSEMADRLESNRAFPLLRNRSRTPQLEAASAVEHAIDDVSAVATRLNQIPLDDENNSTKKRMLANDSRKLPSAFLPSYDDGKSLRKRVQFRSTGTIVEEGNGIGDGEVPVHIAPTNENEKPRSQIIGANEVYNDPRQRRLNEYNVAKSLRPVVDGSSLGFRDKMKLFAEQLGEQIPRNRQNISSAEREIERGDSTNTAVTNMKNTGN